MTQTKIGGAKAAATNKAKYGKDFYKIIGAKGGRNGHTGGFASNTVNMGSGDNTATLATVGTSKLNAGNGAVREVLKSL